MILLSREKKIVQSKGHRKEGLAMKRDKTRRIALDALRGWSALFVVFYHFAIDPRYDPMGYTHNFFTSQAYVFVDLFLC